MSERVTEYYGAAEADGTLCCLRVNSTPGGIDYDTLALFTGAEPDDPSEPIVLHQVEGQRLPVDLAPGFGLHSGLGYFKYYQNHRIVSEWRGSPVVARKLHHYEFTEYEGRVIVRIVSMAVLHQRANERLSECLTSGGMSQLLPDERELIDEVLLTSRKAEALLRSQLEYVGTPFPPS